MNGAKQFITNSGTDISGCVTITAVTGQENGSKEISNIIVPNGTPGYEPGEPYRKMGWNASDTRPLAFDDCRVPEAQPARPPRRRLQAVPRRSSTAAASGSRRWASASPRARSTRRSPTRRSGGPSASRSRKFQAIQAKIADLSAQIEAARLLVYRAALEKDRGESFTLTAAQAKLITGRLAVRATEEAVQIHGGYGYIEEYPVCRFYRDAKILTIGEGTDEVQQMVIARQLGM